MHITCLRRAYLSLFPSFLPPATVRDKYGAEDFDSESSTSEEEDDDAEVMQQINGSS